MTRILQDASPIIIAHRGASGYRPEHTLAAYELAILRRATHTTWVLIILNLI